MPRSNSRSSSSNSNSKHMSLFAPGASHSGGFLQLFEKGRWRAIRKQLRSKNVTQFIRNQRFEGLSSLSVALGHGAPIDIIEKMIDIDPALALQTDFLGATPLHVACLNGADLASVQLLREKYPSLSTKCDKDGRLPLHHAVEYICRLERAGDSVVSNGVEVIKELLKESPETIHCTDKLGDSPLDIAHVIMMETDTSFEEDASTFSRVEFTYKLLKKVSINVYLKRKRQWEEDGYDTSKKEEPKPLHSLGESSGETFESSRSSSSR